MKIKHISHFNTISLVKIFGIMPNGDDVTVCEPFNIKECAK
jgi:hypothetical protein